MTDSLLSDPPAAPAAAAPIDPPAASNGSAGYSDPPNGATPDTPAWVLPDGSLPEGWVNRLPDELAGHKVALEKFKRFPDLVKWGVHAESKLGERFQAPGEGATPEQVAKWHKALGVPDDPAGYDLKPPEKLPDGVAFNEVQAGEFAKVAKEIGLTPVQARKALEFHLQTRGVEEKALMDAAMKQHAENKATLQKEFGDKFDVRVQKFKMFSKDELGISPDHPAYAYPDLVKALMHYTERLQPDRKGAETMEPFQSNAEKATRIQTDATHPLHKAWMGEEGHARQEKFLPSKIKFTDRLRIVPLLMVMRFE